MSNNKVIYTVITDQYDCLFPPLAEQPGWDLICFTDDASLTSGFWDVRPLPSFPEMSQALGDPVRQARLVKILAHRFLTDYEYSVYIDANRVLLDDMETFVQGGKDAMLCLEGSALDPCAAAEALLAERPAEDSCALEEPLVIPAAEEELLRAQIARWRTAGLPRYCGCPATALLGRRRGEAAVAAAMEIWAREVLNGSVFDELALPYAVWAAQPEKRGEFSPLWAERLSPFPAPNHLLSPAEELAARMPHRARLDSGRDWAPRVYPPNPPPPGGPHDGYPLLLTIGVPVSNQIGTIRRCLEGIRPLLEQLPAELVVVDTGSTDGTVEVCREYGARVIDFPWIDDMSAARNQAIRAARGLWYMSIDDDEWFEDAEPFLEFFRSGLYADYDYASYPQRNYSDLAMKRWSDFPTARIARMRPDLHFHGRIHDCYASVILNNKVYYIRAAAHHVGFVYADSWVMRRKMARNIQGLRRDMAQYPADLRFGFHLSREVSFIREYKQALRLAYWVMSMDRGASTAIAGGWRQLTVGMLLISLPNGGWNEQALLLAERWLSLEDYNDISRCALLAVLASVRTRLGDHKGSVECGLRYLELRGELLSLPVRERDLMMNEFMIDSVHERIFRGVLRQMIENYWRLRDFAAADMLIACGDMAELLLEEDLYREKTLTYLYRNRRWPVWQALLTRYRSAGRLDGVDMLLAALAEWSQADDYGEALRLVRASGLKSFGFMAFMDLRLCAEAGAATASGYRQAREFAAGLEGEARYRCQFTLLREVFRLGLDPAPAVAAMDIPATEYLFARLEAETDGPRALWERLLAWHTDIGAEAGVMERYLAMRVSEILFIKLGKSAQLNTDILQTYMERRWQWESALYAPGLLGGGDERLPPWLRAVCQTREALRLWREERDYPAALRAVKSAALLSGVFKETAEKLARLITADYEKEREEGGLAAAANRAEFAALLESVKSEARQLRARGETETAARILTKLAELAPGDAEIGALLSALSADKE